MVMENGRMFGLSDHLSLCPEFSLSGLYQLDLLCLSGFQAKIKTMMLIIFSTLTQWSSTAILIPCDGHPVRRLSTGTGIQGDGQVIYCKGCLLQLSSAGTVAGSHYIYMGSRPLIFLPFKWRIAFFWRIAFLWDQNKPPASLLLSLRQ